MGDIEGILVKLEIWIYMRDKSDLGNTGDMCENLI